MYSTESQCGSKQVLFPDSAQPVWIQTSLVPRLCPASVDPNKSCSRLCPASVDPNKSCSQTLPSQCGSKQVLFQTLPSQCGSKQVLFPDSAQPVWIQTSLVPDSAQPVWIQTSLVPDSAQPVWIQTSFVPRLCPAFVYPVLTIEEGLFTIQSSEMVGGPGETEIVGCNLLPKMPGKKVEIILRKLDFKCWPRTYGGGERTHATA